MCLILVLNAYDCLATNRMNLCLVLRPRGDKLGMHIGIKHHNVKLTRDRFDFLVCAFCENGKFHEYV